MQRSPVNSKLEICRKAFAEARGFCGRAITDVLGRLDDTLPDDAVEMLDWLATQDDAPTEERWQEDAGGGQKYWGGDMYCHGINTTRGGAAEAIRDLIVKNSGYVERFRPTLDRMVRDASAAVRSCVAGTLRAVRQHDDELAMSLFLSMDLSEDGLLATDHVHHFMQGALHDTFASLRTFVVRMLRSVEPEVRQAGGRLAAIAALLHDCAADLAADAVGGDARSRLGVAEVASASLEDERFRSWCETKLMAFFNDPDADVCREAASCFSRLPDETLETYEDLIAAFCDSRALEEDAFHLLQTLEQSRGKLPGTTCTVCLTYLDRMAEATRDSRTQSFTDAHTVVELVFRTYQQHQNDAWTAPALDLIDRLCLEGVPDAGNELEKFER